MLIGNVNDLVAFMPAFPESDSGKAKRDFCWHWLPQRRLKHQSLSRLSYRSIAAEQSSRRKPERYHPTRQRRTLNVHLLRTGQSINPYRLRKRYRRRETARTWMKEAIAK